MSAPPPSLPPKLPTRDDARACLWSNLAVPGLGSWRAGRRVSGALQLLLGATGVALSMAWFAWFLREWLESGRLPILTILDHNGQLPAGWLRYLWVGLAGLGLFVFSLGWALFTSLCIRSASDRTSR